MVICCKGLLFTETSKRLATPTDLARQSVTMVTGYEFERPGILNVKLRVREWPGVFENSSPYHSFPLPRKFIVSSSWNVRSSKEFTTRVGTKLAGESPIRFPLPPIIK